MRIAYFDCFSGLSGDLILGALLDAGLSLDALRTELAKLPFGGYAIDVQKVLRQGMAYTSVSVSSTPAPSASGNGHKSASGNGTGPDHVYATHDLVEGIASSSLPDEVKRNSLAAMRLLVETEYIVYGKSASDTAPSNQISDVVTLVQIVGAIAGLSLLRVERVECSPVNVGGGFVKTAHGLLPVPTPAAAEILRSVATPIYGTNPNTNKDLVTPTGAAIIACMASIFGPMPPLTIEKLGYGAEKSDPEGNSSLLRMTIGELASQPPSGYTVSSRLLIKPDEEMVTLIEANLEDLNPRYTDFIMDRLLVHGALDVFLVPLQMKGNRPGALLSVLCKPDRVDALAAIIFEETATLGMRISESPRRTLRWEVVEAQTEWGPVKVKLASNADGKVIHVKPEYDDVKRVALEFDLSIDHVYDESSRAWSQHLLDGHQQMGRHRERTQTRVMTRG